MELEELRQGAVVRGFVANDTVDIKYVEQLGPDVVAVFGVDSGGQMHNRTVSRADAESLQVAGDRRKWAEKTASFPHRTTYEGRSAYLASKRTT